MRLTVSADARPQVQSLLLVTLLSVALWFIPYADYLTYPFRLFVTFIHEGGHALASWLTGNSVLSLSVSPDTSGLTLATQGGFVSQVIVSSAGYVGAMAFGALLLVLIRRGVAARIVLMGHSGFDSGVDAGVWLALAVRTSGDQYLGRDTLYVGRGTPYQRGFAGPGALGESACCRFRHCFSGRAVCFERAAGFEDNFRNVFAVGTLHA